MKIPICKIALSTICLFMLTGGLIAQTPPHLGTNNQFPIGDKDIPAKVYLLSLKEEISQDKSWNYSFSRKCYDGSFMTVNGYEANPNACIQCNSGWMAHYNYAIIPGHEEDIIDAVSSEELQSAFNNWFSENQQRLNHTRSELCDYINNMLEIAIEPARSEVSRLKVSQFENSNFTSTESQQIIYDNVALIVNMISTPNSSEAWVPAYLLNFWDLDFSTEEDSPFPGLPKHAVVKKSSGNGNDREIWATNKWFRDSFDNAIIIDHEGEKFRIEDGVLAQFP